MHPSPTRSTRAPAAAAAVLALAGLLAGCGDSDDTADDPQPSAATSSASTPTQEASPTPDDRSDAASESTSPDLDVTIEGDDVSPSGDRLEVGIGQAVTIHVSSDRAGELHVHSTPEQELEYAEGETDLELTIDKPGIVDVEDHVADVVIAQLEVS